MVFFRLFPLHTKLTLLGWIRGQKILILKRRLGDNVLQRSQILVFAPELPDCTLVLQAFFERQMRLSFFVQYLVTFFGTTKKSGWQIDK